MVKELLFPVLCVSSRLVQAIRKRLPLILFAGRQQNTHYLLPANWDFLLRLLPGLSRPRHHNPQRAAQHGSGSFPLRRFGLASDKGRALALILATATIARHRADPAAGWNREIEENIIRQALAEPRVLPRGKLGSYNTDTRVFDKVTHEAARIVATFFS